MLWAMGMKLLISQSATPTTIKETTKFTTRFIGPGIEVLELANLAIKATTAKAIRR